MNLRPFLPLLLGAFLLPASMESAHANPFSATSSSTNSLLEPRSNLPLRSDAYVVVNPKTGETLAVLPARAPRLAARELSQAA